MSLIFGSMLMNTALAMIFALAALAKFADLEGTQRMLGAFGVPAFFERAGSVLLPVCELCVAAGLLVPVTARDATFGAVLLLSIFTAAMAYNIARGRRPSCNCFGQIDAQPIGKRTLVRNAWLTSLAAFAAFVEPARAATFGLAAPLYGPRLLMISLLLSCLFFFAVAVFLLLKVIRGQDAMQARLDMAPWGKSAGQNRPMPTSLPVGSKAPEFSLNDLGGSTVTLSDLVAGGRPALLFFTSPTCPPCKTLSPEIEKWQREHSDKLNIVRITEGAADKNRYPGTVLLQKAREVADAYQSWGTPGAVLVNADGTIGSEMARGVPGIRALVEKVVGAPVADAVAA